MSIGTTIKRLRRSRSMTQEQLAARLGITANAVSQWECDRTAPDIAQLPLLAGLLEVTIDALFENDDTARQADIERFFGLIREELPNDAMKERLRLGREYAAKYPKNFDIAHELCWIIVRSDKTEREANLPLLRRLCDKIMAECTVQTYRESAIALMCTYGSDEDFEKWSALCATDYCAYRGEVLERRLEAREAYDECAMRKGANKLELFCHLLLSDCGNRTDAEKSLAWVEYRIALIQSFGESGIIPQAWLGYYAVMLTYAADQSFRLLRDEDGYRALAEAYRVFAEWADIPDGTALGVGADWMFHGVEVLKNEWNYRFPDGKEEYSNYMALFANYGTYLETVMKKQKGWQGFARMRNEERYRETLAKAEALARKGQS